MADPSDPTDALDAVVADYLQRAEAGAPPDREALLAAYPGLADRLQAFFADLDRMASRGAALRLPDLSLPEDFGDYEVLGEIGRGGMGVVYRARQKSLGRVVALKMVLGGWVIDPVAVARFRDEAATVSRLDHPHVVPVYEVGEHRGHPYFSMKLVGGRSLTRCLDRYLGDPRAAAELLAKVCGAVHHAHQRGVLHRDLKPGNILVDPGGEPHVTDFGLARRAEEARGHTRSGVVVGTPEYMSPEQAAGSADLTTAVDVYGLGAVLYALLTGRPPFPGADVYHTLRAVVEDEPVAPRKLRREAPGDLQVICLKCLSKDPARRYTSAEALGADLGRWLKGEPIAARRVGRLTRLRMWARRRPTAAALLGVTAASAVLLVGGGVYFGRELSDSNARLTSTVGDLTTTNDILTRTQKQFEDRTAESEDRAKKLAETAAALRKNEYSLEVATYAGKLALALRELDAGDKAKALAILDECQWDLRGWEFDHLVARCTTPDAAVTLRDRHEVPADLAVASHAGHPLVAWVGSDAARADRRDFIKTKVDASTRLRFHPDPVESGFEGEGHRGRVTCVALGRNGRTACSGDSDGAIKVWWPPALATRGEQVGAIGINPATVRGMVAGRDGKSLYLDTFDPSAAIYELPGGKLVREIPRPDGRDGGSLTLTPDGSRFLWAGCVWDARDGARVRDFGAGFVGTAFSPDGKRVAGLGPAPEGGRGRPWSVRDVATGDVVVSSDEPAEFVGFGPSADRVVTARATPLGKWEWDVQFRLHDGRTGAVVGEHPAVVRVDPGDSQDAHRFFSSALVLESCELHVRALEVGPAGDAVAATLEFRAAAKLVVPVIEGPSPNVTGEREVSVGERRWRTTTYWQLPDASAPKPKWPVRLTRVGRASSTLSDPAISWGPSRLPVRTEWHDTIPNGDGRRPVRNPWELSLIDGATGEKLTVVRDTWPAHHRWDLPPVVAAATPGGDCLVAGWDRAGGLRVYRVHRRHEWGALAGHAGAVNDLALTDRGRLASAGADGTVGVWDVVAGKRLHTLKGHAGPVRCVAVSPDEKLVVSGGDDGTVRVWDAATGEPLRALAGHAGPVRCVAFLPDGTGVVTGGDDASVRLWSVADGQLRHTFPGRPWPSAPFPRAVLQAVAPRLPATGHVGPVTGVAAVNVFPSEPRADVLLFSGGADGRLCVWSVGKKALASAHDAHPGGVRTLGAGGSRVYTGGEDGTIRTWQPGLPHTTEVGPEPFETVNWQDELKGGGLSFTPDGRHLFVPDGGLVRVWDVRSGEVARTIGRPDWAVEAVALGPDGKSLTAWGPSPRMTGDVPYRTVLDFATGLPVAGSAADGPEVSPVARALATWARSGVAVADGPPVRLGVPLRDPLSGEVARAAEASQEERGRAANRYHPGLVGWGGEASTPAGDRFAGRGADGVAIRDAKTKEVLATCATPSEVMSAVFTADGRRLITGSTDGVLRVWDSHTGQLLLTLPDEALGRYASWKGGIVDLVFSPDGTHLAGLVEGQVWRRPGPVEQHRVRVWRTAATPRPAPVLSNRAGYRYSGPDAAVSPDGRFSVGYTSRSSRLEVNDLATGKLLRSLPADRELNDRGPGVVFLPRSPELLLRSGQRLDLATGRETGRLPDGSGRFNGPLFGPSSPVAVTADESTLVGLRYGQLLYVRDLASGRVLAARSAPFQLTSAFLTLHPGGRYVIVRGANETEGTLWVWAIPKGGEDADFAQGNVFPPVEELGRLEGGANVTISPDGRFVAAGVPGQGPPGVVRVWDGTSLKPVRDLPGAGVLAFSPDGAWLAVGGADVEVWSTTTWEKRYTLRKPDGAGDPSLGWPVALTFAADGRSVQALYDDYLVGRLWLREWDLATGRPTRRVRDGGLRP